MVGEWTRGYHHACLLPVSSMSAACLKSSGPVSNPSLPLLSKALGLREGRPGTCLGSRHTGTHPVHGGPQPAFGSLPPALPPLGSAPLVHVLTATQKRSLQRTTITYSTPATVVSAIFQEIMSVGFWKMKGFFRPHDSERTTERGWGVVMSHQVISVLTTVPPTAPECCCV